MIERPSCWEETTWDRDRLFERLRETEDAGSAKELQRLVVAVGFLLDWLEMFLGVSWQQRWLASGVDSAGRDWAARVEVDGQPVATSRRGEVTGAAARLILLGALRPSYYWLYQFRSRVMLNRFPGLHEPEGFAALDPICEQTERFTPLDRSFAYHQLTRILIHNGGRLGDILPTDLGDVLVTPGPAPAPP